MVDISFTQTAIHKRPREGISSPNTLRVFNSAPHCISLQIRDTKGYSTANLTVAQVNALIDALVEACNKTFPPLPEEELLRIVRG